MDERAETPEKAPPYVGKDGIERNIVRIRWEFGQALVALGSTLKDLVTLKGGPKNIAHNYVDCFVEPLRACPYALGHVLAIVALVAMVFGGMSLAQ